MAVIKNIISTSILTFFKDIGCKNCGDTDVTEVLEKTIFHPKDRGNENDKIEWWCRKCSKDDSTWKEHEKLLKKEREEEEKKFQKDKAEIISKVSSATNYEELNKHLECIMEEHNIYIG